jgi:hypothetical protein
MKTTFKQNQLSLEEKNKIIIFVLSSEFGGKIRVNQFDPVSILFQLLTSQNIVVLYKGNVLNSKSTFFNCGISQYDRTILINQKQINFKTETFGINLSKTESNLNQFGDIEYDLKMKREFGRLTDLKLIKCENKPDSFHKLANQLSF